ncbi:hypothetical protein JK358_04600 [Nocardia sp. 2]|uniref:Uncharacterized protein n=1 Tax=Nocardia acididurans TaxID=2802282 RepID=A0ABS1LZK7_9NOCA|nr:hypothetical protein [Nocardia acididurans]MBL1073666.1 hypothetical protein [Nocardia acididurans]
MPIVNDVIARVNSFVAAAPMAPVSVDPLNIPIPEVVDLGAAITTLDRVHSAPGGPGAAVRMARSAAGEFRREFAATGTVEQAATHDLVTLPYPTKFGLWRASVTPTPFLFITNRLVIVRWTEAGGRVRTLLWEPSDVELDGNTPYFAALARRTPEIVLGQMLREHATVAERVAQAGIDPAEVDYLAFDHLHTQDVRRLIGTVRPQADISPESAVPALFPNARLVVQRDELEAMRDLHPLQRPWYQPETFVDLDPARILPIDGDRLLAPGVAIVRTPGHATGNQTLVLNTDSGIWAMSENVIAAECLTPQHSRIPGVAGWASAWGQELILNANTLESTAQQYAFCVVEKTLVDRSQADERFLQFFPTSELTASRYAPGTRPTFSHGSLRQGV